MLLFTRDYCKYCIDNYLALETALIGFLFKIKAILKTK